MLNVADYSNRQIDILGQIQRSTSLCREQPPKVVRFRECLTSLRLQPGRRSLLGSLVVPLALHFSTLEPSAYHVVGISCIVS